jgi:hypothetical protein
MNGIQTVAAVAFGVMIAFCWLYYFRHNIFGWWRERGPRRQLAQEAAQQREEELTRLREELASKYLPPRSEAPPASEG